MIDVHNYLRKVSIHAPEGRKTARWEMRFFMQLLAGSTVDAYLAYKRLCPNKDTCTKMTSCST